MPSGAKSEPGALSHEIAAILRGQMARKGVTQRQLAEAVGIAQTQVSGIIRARKHVDVEMLDEICQALGMEFGDLIREADEATSARFTDEGRPRTIVEL